MKVLVLGIGNIMFSDEGIGVHICQQIKNNYTFFSENNSVDFVDGGTLAHRLIPIMVEYDQVFIFDCVDVDNAKFGEVYFFDYEDMPSHISWQGSAHEVEMLQTLQMMDLVGDRPPTKIIGIIPKVIEDTTFQISNEVKKGALLMEKILIQELKKIGFTIKKVQDIPLQEIANNSYKS